MRTLHPIRTLSIDGRGEDLFGHLANPSRQPSPRNTGAREFSGSRRLRDGQR